MLTNVELEIFYEPGPLNIYETPVASHSCTVVKLSSLAIG